MCECVEQLKESIKKQFGTENKPIAAVELTGTSLGINMKEGSVLNAVFVDFKARVENQKKRITVPVKWTFCPFCGDSLTESET